MSVAAVVVSCNRLEYLKRSVHASLLAGVDEIVVVDNASDDGTIDWLKSIRDSRVTSLYMSHNCGASGGFAAGFDYVINNSEAEWLVCFDDDSYPELNALTEFAKLYIPRSVMGVAASVFLPNGEICEMNRPSRNPFKNLKTFVKTIFHSRSGFHVADHEYESNELKPIDFSSFVGFFVRVNAVKEKLGLPRKELFIYADDMIYTHGIKAAGGQLLFAPSVRFVHDCQTFHKATDVYKPLWKVYYTYRNRVELFRLVAWDWLFYPIAVLKLISWLMKFRFYESKTIYVKVALAGWWDGMKGYFGRTHQEIKDIAQNKVV